MCAGRGAQLLGFKMGEFVGGLKVVFRVFVHFKATFRLTCGVVPDGAVMVGVFSVRFQLPQVSGYGFVFSNIDLFHVVDNGAVVAVLVVIKTEDAFSIRSNSNGFIGHALAYAREVEHVLSVARKGNLCSFIKARTSL